MTAVEVLRMDGPDAALLVRLALDELAAVEELRFDLAARRVEVVHDGPPGPIVQRIAALGLGSRRLAAPRVRASSTPRCPSHAS